MKKILSKIIELIGRFFGFLFSPFNHHSLSFILYTFHYSFITALYKYRFKEFGKNSKLISAPDELRLCDYIKIGNDCRLGRHLLLRCYKIAEKEPELKIGSLVNIGDYSTISCCNQIVIENGVRTGRMVMITDNAHGHTDSIEELDISPIMRPLVSKGPVIIKKNVWIGEKVSIMPGVTIGEGSIIAANAVVTKSIPPFCIAGGCPAKVIKIIR